MTAVTREVLDAIRDKRILNADTDLFQTFRPWARTAAEITAGVTPVNYAYAPGDVRRYGSKGDGTTDDTAALNKAFSIVGVTARLPAGTYEITANLAVPVCSGIEGDGWDETEIVAATGVTRALSIDGVTALRYSGFRITGNATTNARGLVLGETIGCSNLVVSDVWVEGFTGTGAIGVSIQNVVTLRIVNPYFNGNTVNVQIGGSSGLPTTVQTIGGAIRAATTIGCKITSGHNVQFRGSVFEANVQEGLYALTASSRLIEDLLVDGCWFEDNYHGHVDTGTQVYSAIVSGVTASATAIFRDTRFSQGAILSDRKSMQINKASVTLDNVRAYFGFAAEFTIINALSFVQVIGDIADRCARFISNPDAAQVDYPIYGQIIELGTGLSLKPGTWRTWTPTYSSSIGNQAATFSGGTVTTTLARYALVGKLLTVEVVASGTLNAVIPIWIGVSVPVGVPQNSNIFGTSLTSDAGTAAMAPIQTNTGGTMRVSKNAGGANYTSGGAISIAFSFSFEIA